MKSTFLISAGTAVEAVLELESRMSEDDGEELILESTLDNLQHFFQ